MVCAVRAVYVTTTIRWWCPARLFPLVSQRRLDMKNDEGTISAPPKELPPFLIVSSCLHNNSFSGRIIYYKCAR